MSPFDYSVAMTEKTARERAVNNLLLLFLIDQADRLGSVEDNVKAQKLVFLVEKNLVQRKLKGFSYNFFRWHKGPFSANLGEDLSGLVDSGMVRKTLKGYRLTDEGRKALEMCRELFEANSDFAHEIESVAKEFAHLSPDEIRGHVYGMDIFVPRLRKTMKVRDIPESQLMLYDMPAASAKRVFGLDDDWQATVELLLDNEAVESLKIAQQDATEGRVAVVEGL